MADTVKAYVLMEIEIGKTDSVVEHIRSIPQATRIAITTGVYDIVVLLEVASLEELYDITVHHIHNTPGIKDTQTAVVEKMMTI
ncbi:Lrp/AsnC family transcriptional regulator [Candidatus Thorarchaeota archaeon]|nr:MAG: Lrp/AsnC family transcriptional regulator [Candidatus Thorarchaeota archaeon]